VVLSSAHRRLRRRWFLLNKCMKLSARNQLLGVVAPALWVTKTASGQLAEDGDKFLYCLRASRSEVSTRSCWT
jgi:hypothetical protein